MRKMMPLDKKGKNCGIYDYSTVCFETVSPICVIIFILVQ